MPTKTPRRGAVGVPFTLSVAERSRRAGACFDFADATLSMNGGGEGEYAN